MRRWIVNDQKARRAPWFTAGDQSAGFLMDMYLTANTDPFIGNALDSSGCSLRTEFDLAVGTVSPSRKNQSEPTPLFRKETFGRTGTSRERTALGIINLREARSVPARVAQRRSGSSENSSNCSAQGPGCSTRRDAGRAGEREGDCREAEAEATSFSKGRVHGALRLTIDRRRLAGVTGL